MNDLSLFFVIFIGFFVLVSLLGVINARRDEQAFRQKLARSFGLLPDRIYEPERIARIPRFFEKHTSGFVIDDITANDLDVWQLFARVSYCQSAAGEEVLYHLLRTPCFDTDVLDARERMIRVLTSDPSVRVDLQTAFHRLGGSGKYSVYDYLDTLKLVRQKSNLPHYLGIAALIASAVLLIFSFTTGFLCLLCCAVFQIVTYFRGKKECDAYLAVFSYVLRLIFCAERVEKILMSADPDVRDAFHSHAERLKDSRTALSQFRRGSGVLMSSSRMGGSGNPLDIFADYIRILTHIDLIKFDQMVKEAGKHGKEIDTLIASLGEIEAWISVACFRASLPHDADGSTGYCLPHFSDPSDDTTFSVMDLRHALLEEGAVSNSMTVKRPVLLTGSNASGKSTWLKSMGLAALMAQTIHTVTAKAYRAPACRIYSSMALSDNLQNGESYYIVEIRALSRVLQAAGCKDEPPVLCFIDEVLRGTNTVERIAASAQILSHFSTQNVLLFAATHDLELTELLKDRFDNYHFEGELLADDVHFDYLLKEGPSVTRNAIGLLKRFSYDSSITGRAEEMAARFIETGVWSL
ncbi:MAG: hypothetical protein K6G16_04775 [Lachnospiraceae bacterium]|nr:hypothetical protein [Lachnospiraceae bacterium]